MTDQPNAYVLAWLDNPDGGGRFTNQRDAIRSHNQTCPGLNHAWLPHKGGVSCPGDFMSCSGCDIEFFWEGLIAAFDDCPESNHWYCACCLAKTTTCGCTSGATR
jgi:hypothetical protein